MRIEAKRQQSKSPHKRGVRHPLGLMEPIVVGALFEPRSGHTATQERPAEESRSIHDQLGEPHSPSDRLHHCLCTFCRWRFFVPMNVVKKTKKKRKKKKIKQSNVRNASSSITATSILDRLDEPRSNCSHPLTWNVSFDGHSSPFQPNRTGLLDQKCSTLRDYLQSQFWNEAVLSKPAVFIERKSIKQLRAVISACTAEHT